MASQLCTTDFTEFLQKLLPGKNSDKILWFFYIADLFFTQLDCMSWPKQMADAWKNDH